MNSINASGFHRICYVFFLAFIFSSCLNTKKDASFSGTWKTINENFISGSSEEVLSSITYDGDRFRIENDYMIQIFDGTFLYYKMKYANEQTETTQEAMDLAQSKQYIFWKKPLGKNKGAGGTIAGRSTTLYEIGVNRPDAEIATQDWIDAETGTVLKSINAIYSKQIGQMVTRNTTECISISYQKPGSEVFAKP